MKKEHVNLTEVDQAELERITQTGNRPAKTFKRALALLELNKGKTYATVAQFVGVAHQTVSIWANKYKAEGLEFLIDKPRSGRPVTITSVERAQITALACSEPPEGYSRWTVRLLADKAVELDDIDTISRAEVGRILKKMNSSPTANDNG
jgi:transposase